jgi:hypothetical protein
MFILSIVLGGIGAYGLTRIATTNNETKTRFFKTSLEPVVGGSQLAISGFLSVSLFFILLDSSVASNFIDELASLHCKKELKMSHFNLVRNNINARVTKSAWLTYSLVLVAFMNMIEILFIFLFANVGSQIDTILMTMMFLKELPFLVIVLYQCATVNEKADQLTKMLGSDAWDIEQTMVCNERVLLFMNAESNPISFPLAGMRLSYKVISRQFAAWCIAFIFGVLKTIALN